MLNAMLSLSLARKNQQLAKNLKSSKSSKFAKYLILGWQHVATRILTKIRGGGQHYKSRVEKSLECHTPGETTLLGVGGVWGGCTTFLPLGGFEHTRTLSLSLSLSLSDICLLARKGRGEEVYTISAGQAF